ncbi:MAG: hypothetical protein AABX51_01810 [Nanoarchaeota archaeon]
MIGIDGIKSVESVNTRQLLVEIVNDVVSSKYAVPGANLFYPALETIMVNGDAPLSPEVALAYMARKVDQGEASLDIPRIAADQTDYNQRVVDILLFHNTAIADGVERKLKQTYGYFMEFGDIMKREKIWDKSLGPNQRLVETLLRNSARIFSGYLSRIQTFITYAPDEVGAIHQVTQKLTEGRESRGPGGKVDVLVLSNDSSLPPYPLANPEQEHAANNLLRQDGIDYKGSAMMRLYPI